jgi:exonuclease SbcD
MAGFDHEFTTGALFAAGAQAFMLGHIHRHQAWENADQCIAYAGSIGRFHYGEQGDKGFLVWDIDASGARFALHATPARRTVDIVFEGKPDLAQIEAVAAEHDLQGAYVRVRWTIPDEDRHEIDRNAIERVLAQAAEVKLEGRIVPVVRTRAAGISKAGSVAQMLAVWADTTEVHAKPLLDRLAQLSVSSPEEIAQAIVAGATGGEEDARDASTREAPTKVEAGTPGECLELFELAGVV